MPRLIVIVAIALTSTIAALGSSSPQPASVRTLSVTPVAPNTQPPAQEPAPAPEPTPEPTAPPTTTTPPPPPPPPTTQAPPATTAAAAPRATGTRSYEWWEAIANCESGNTNGWRTGYYGIEADHPIGDLPKGEQLAWAERIYADYGDRAWGCSPVAWRNVPGG